MTTVEILRSAEYPIGHKFKNPYTRTHRVRGICLVCMVIIEPVVHSTTGSSKRSFCKAKNERSLEQTKISGTVTTVDTTNVDILNFLCYT